MRRGLPAEFDVVIARAMAKLPDERYASAGDLGRAARAAALGRSPTEPERMVARGAAAPDAAPTEPGLAAEAETRTAVAAPPPAQPRRWVPQLAGGALILLAAVLTLALRNEPDAAPNAATVATSSPTPTVTVTVTASPTPTATATAAIAKKVAQVTHVGSRPSGIALAGGDAWVMSPDRPRLTRVSLATLKERKHHPELGWGMRAIVGYGGSVWVASGSKHQILRLDARTGRVGDHFAVPGDPQRLAVNHDGVWVGLSSPEGQSGQVLRLDRRTGERLDTFTLAEGVGPMVATPEALFVTKRDIDTLTRVEPGTAAPTDIVRLAGPLRSMRYARGTIYMIFQDEDTIARISTNGHGMVFGSAGHRPSQAQPLGKHVFVTARNDQSVLVLRPDDLLEAQEPIRVGLNPVAMAASGKSLYVVSLDAKLTKIDYL